jgi:hypothetical protein
LFEAFCYWLSDGETFLMRFLEEKRIAEGKRLLKRKELLKENC